MDISEELAKFRERWKAEVQTRKAHTEGEAATSSSRATGPPLVAHTPIVQQPVVAQSSTSGHVTSNPIPKTTSSSLDIYRRAVLAEQAGDVDEALQLYQQAFRVEPNVDKLYHRQEVLSGISHSHPKLKEHVSPSSLPLPLVSIPVGKTTLSELIEHFYQENPELSFIPEDEKLPIFIRGLPNEVLIHILRLLDATSLERFAATCRKARVVSLDPDIWREFVTMTYKPPQVRDITQLMPVVERFMADYRRVYVEQPRVRMDGVYIAVCHYIRAGLSENHWVNVNHLITYHRYLRFFPNGQVLSLLANDDPGPSHVIPLLKPNARLKGLHVGTWRLEGTTVYLETLVEASGRFHVPLNGDASLDPDCRYVFSMSLNLLSRPLGRWNRMEITGYDSIKVESGDASPITLKNERPFWFSKVRSY